MRALLLLALVGCGGALGSTASLDRVAYPSGKARFEFELRGGIPNGRGRAWHRNGKLASDGTYKDGARNGQFWFYGEDGAFVAQAIYVDNVEVWRSSEEQAAAPPAWSEYVAARSPEPPSDATMVELDDEMPGEGDRSAPRPYFSIVDRTTAPARAGAQVGVSNAQEHGFGATKRVDVYGHYRTGPYGVFAQVSETRLSLEDEMSLAGRVTTVVAGTYHRPLGFATLSTNAGFITPLGDVDATASVASYMGAKQRPADAAFSVPAPFTLRSGASLTASQGRAVVQVDAGLDAPLGAAERGVDLLGRANIGVGIGSRSTLLTAELDNTLHLAGAHEWLHALAVGGTVSYPIVWISASLVFAPDTITFLGTVGRDL